MRIKPRPLRKRRHLSTGDQIVFQWLNIALPDEHWRDLIHERLAKAKPVLKEIQF